MPTSLTLTSPTAGGPLPDRVTPVGGIVLDLVGLGGRRVVSQVGAAELFRGNFSWGLPEAYRGNPGTIGVRSGFSPGVLDLLGGGLAELAVRLTVFDGDSGPGDFDGGGIGQELLLSGNEEILRGSDHGTLVAFAAIAFQELRGGGEAAHHVGCVVLLFSVLFCVLVHFAAGNAYLHRAMLLIRGRSRRDRRQRATRAVNLGLVWAAVLGQFACLAVGLLLILPKRPPGLLVRHLIPLFD